VDARYSNEAMETVMAVVVLVSPARGAANNETYVLLCLANYQNSSALHLQVHTRGPNI
jgi:hypothetical protein